MTTTTPIAVDTDGTAEIFDAELVEDSPAAEVAIPVDKGVLATRLLAIAVLEARIAAAKADLRAALYGQMKTGESLVGCLDPDDDDPVSNETALGKVLKKKGASAWKVTDPEAFLAWVKAKAPTEVITTEKVRDSYVTAVLAQLKKDKGLNKTTGEVVIPDGITFSENSPTLSVTKSADAETLVEMAVAAGHLRADGTLAIEAGR
jgi:hypothetical protein